MKTTRRNFLVKSGVAGVAFAAGFEDMKGAGDIFTALTLRGVAVDYANNYRKSISQ